MTTLTDLLRKNNCSVDAAIKRMRVKQELYESFVRDFRDDSSFSSYEYALKIEDYDVAYREAHTLKGLTASLGFDDLHTTVCKITRAILNHDYKQVIFLNDELISRYELITGLIGFIE